VLSSVLLLEDENVRVEERKALFGGNAFVQAGSSLVRGAGYGGVLPVVTLLGASGLATASPALRKGRLARG